MDRQLTLTVIVRRVALAGLAVLLLGTGALGTPPRPAAAACATYTLPSLSYLQLVRRDGYAILLQRSVRSGFPTARIWEKGRYTGEYNIPIDVADIRVRLELRLVPEMWMGRVRYVHKQVPVAQACDNWAVRTVPG